MFPLDRYEGGTRGGTTFALRSSGAQMPRVRVPRDHKYWSKLLFIFSSAGKPALPNASRSTTGAAGSLLLIRMMASSPVPDVVGHECDGEVQLFTRSDHYWCARQRQHEYPIGAHQPLHAADDKVGRI